MAGAASSFVEHGDDRTRKARELVKRVKDVARRRHAGFVKSYIGGELYFGLRRALPQAAEYGFIIGAVPFSPSGRDKIALDADTRNCDRGGMGLDREQPLMLTFNVEIMEGPKGIVSSFVRLERFDEMSFGRGKPLYKFVPLVLPTRKDLGARDDGKIGLVWVRDVIAVGERRSEDVQAGSDAVDVGAHLDVERERKRLFFDRYNDIIRRLRIRVFNSHLNVVVDPTLEPLFEGWEVGYGPVNCCLSL